MCDGTMLGLGGWVDFAGSAAAAHQSVPASAGAYVVRAATIGLRDLDEVRRAYERSAFVKAMRAGDRHSETLLASFGFGQGWGWRNHTYATSRLDRLAQVTAHLPHGGCRIVYIGKANYLRRRMRELTCGGHTANHAVWALLHAGWTFEVAFQPTEPGSEAAMELSLKERFALAHGGRLPALVAR